MGTHNFQPYEEAYLQLCLERDRVLCSPEFLRAPLMSHLLTYLVGHRLSNDPVPLKAYTIAVEALRRAEDFDPQTDSYPRVQVGRLRKMLEIFYAHEGGDKRLSIPIGSYEIDLVPFAHDQKHIEADIPVLVADPLPALMPTGPIVPRLPAQKRGRPIIVVSLGVLFVLSVFALFQVYSKAFPGDVDYPSLTILKPTSSANAADADFSNRAYNFTSEALYRFEGIRVYQENRPNDGTADYVLATSVVSMPYRQATMKLFDRKSNELIWSETLKADVKDDAIEFALSKVAVAIAGPYGAIARDQHKKLKDSYQSGYPCLLQFDGYLRYRDEEQLRPSLHCMQKSVKVYPNDAYVLSMAAFASYVAKQRRVDPGFEVSGASLAQRALHIDPQSASSNFAVARSAFFDGDCAAGKKWGDSAITINPNDMRITGYLSIYLTACEDADGATLAARALAIDPNADLVVASNLAYIKLIQGDNSGAYALSRHYLVGAPRVEPGLEVVGALSAAAVGHRREAQQLWAAVSKRFGMPANSSAHAVLHQFVTNPLLLTRLEKSVQASKLAS
jgi:hypothetical protein